MTRPVPGALEQRDAPEAAAPTVEGKRLRGVVPYGVESRDLGGWSEILSPGCLTGADLSDLVATVDHGGLPLARHPGTLTLEDRDDGMHWSLDLPESRGDVREAVERGDIRSSSWRMVVKRDEWRGQIRHVHEISALRDVAAVTSPAYAAARAEYRAAPEPTPNHQEAPVPDPVTPPAGGLRVEDRTAHDPRATVEARVLAAMGGVPAGEMRDLTHATAEPVEPDDLRTQLVAMLRERSVVLASGANLVTTDKKAVVYPTLTAGIDSRFYDELEEIDLDQPEFGEFEVPVKAIKALVRGSAEAFEDSDPDLLQIVADELNLSLALKGDRSLVAGSIVTEPKGFNGLLNVPGAQSIAVNGPLTWDHIIKATGLLAEAFVPGGYATLMGPRVGTALALVKETSTSNAYLATPAGVPPTYSTSWLPVTGTTSPKTTVIVYAPSQTTVVLRRTVTVEVDRSKGFSADAVYVRGRYRLGLGVAHGQSVVRLSGVDAPSIS